MAKATTALLTPEEQRVLDALVEAWNLFMGLPYYHPDDRGEFRMHLHALQYLILMRPAYAALRGEEAAFDDRIFVETQQ